MIALSIALIVGLGGLGSAMAANTGAQAAPTQSAGAVLDNLMASGELSRMSMTEIFAKLTQQGVTIPAAGTEAWVVLTADINSRREVRVTGTSVQSLNSQNAPIGSARNPVRLTALTSKVTVGGDTKEWSFDQSGSAPLSGRYNLPPNSDNIYSWENEFNFLSSGDALRGANRMDVITFATLPCRTPPERIYSIEDVFLVMGPQPTGHGVRKIVRFWNNWNPSVAGAGSSVVSTLLGTLNFDYGRLPTNTYGVDINTVSPLITPTHGDNIAVEFKYVDNVSGALISVQQLFGEFPSLNPTDNPTADGNGPLGFGPPAGSSGNFFYSDAPPYNGVLETNEAFLFTTALPSKFFSNLHLHIGGQTPATEVELNDTQATATPACICTDRTGNIGNPGAGDVDWWKFNVEASGKVKIEVICAPGKDVTVSLRNSGGGLEAGADDHGVDGICNETIISPVLTIGDHGIEIHEKGDDGTVAYELKITPIADIATNLKFDVDKVTFRWDSQAGGALYDVMRGNLSVLHSSGGDFTNPNSPDSCWDINLANPVNADPTTPTGPADSLWYISRAKNTCGGVGVWEEGGNQIGLRDPEIATNINVCP